jgi:glycosyltransferase involved in cell wall biosynthesis
VAYEGYNEKLFKPTKTKTLFYPYFLFVGTIQPRKNLIRLITAYAKFLSVIHNLHPIPIVLVGSKGWLSEEIYALPKKLGIENQVKFLGYVPDDKLPPLYCGAKALLLPSLFEGFGLPILEAMACGCPVLTSRTSSMPEVAGKAALLVNPYSIEDISQGIIALATNHKLRAKLIHLGFEQIKKFSWEKCAQETLQILTKITSG